jgi:DNA-binding XRE family transcriptional regulator
MREKSFEFELDLYLPDPYLTTQLKPCPNCGAEYCIDGERKGPTILMHTSVCYRAVCLNCIYKAAARKTDIEAMEAWNKLDKPGRLREIRKSKGLSQYDLAQLAGIGYTAISNFENHRRIPSNEIRRKLAKALNVSEDVL